MGHSSLLTLGHNRLRPVLYMLLGQPPKIAQQLMAIACCVCAAVYLAFSSGCRLISSDWGIPSSTTASPAPSTDEEEEEEEEDEEEEEEKKKWGGGRWQMGRHTDRKWVLFPQEAIKAISCMTYRMKRGRGKEKRDTEMERWPEREQE